MDEITFIVPVYNAEKTLTRTIDSILKQSDDRYQIVIIDDGSKDQTSRIGKQYAAQHPDKIRYHYQENKGLGGARNTGLCLVETEYVSFLDGDDWLMPDYVERILRCIKQVNEAPEMIMTLPEIYHEQSRAVREWYDKKLFDLIFLHDGDVTDPVRELRLYQFEVNVCRKVLHIDFIRETGFSFKEGIKWEDVYPHFYLLSRCHRCMGVAVGFYYRIGSSTQITASGGSDSFDVIEVFDELIGYIARGHKELIFPAMRVIVRFSFWRIHMADRETRKPLVVKLHAFFKRIPKDYIRILKRECRKQYSTGDAIQYALLITALRYKLCSVVFYDYLWQEICEKLVKKILKAENKVA